jgi:hypothetical protein
MFDLDALARLDTGLATLTRRDPPPAREEQTRQPSNTARGCPHAEGRAA